MNLEHTLIISEGERQMLILALAELALSRPGWDDALGRIAQRLDDPGNPMFMAMKRINADRVRAERGPMGPLIAQQDEEDIQRWLFGVCRGDSERGKAGDFLLSLAAAALRADPENYPILRPVVLAMKIKFPEYRAQGDLT